MSNANSSSRSNSVTDMSNISQEETETDLSDDWYNEDDSLEDSGDETQET